jgi:hypothetical protein
MIVLPPLPVMPPHPGRPKFANNRLAIEAAVSKSRIDASIVFGKPRNKKLTDDHARQYVDTIMRDPGGEGTPVSTRSSLDAASGTSIRKVPATVQIRVDHLYRMRPPEASVHPEVRDWGHEEHIFTFVHCMVLVRITSSHNNTL